MTTKASTPKGMRDFSPSVMFRRNYIFSVVKSAFEKYGFSPIETPAMENSETLTGKYGDEGKPIVEADPNHKISKIYLELASRIKSSFFNLT